MNALQLDTLELEKVSKDEIFRVPNQSAVSPLH